ncbi:MAG: efflux RND transporter periplasmic adaptor subunit [Pseudomonadales bacterium]|nr:efflux RND transporter periplasmic adaptor subunit [Pseudomonadales bacterium]
MTDFSPSRYASKWFFVLALGIGVIAAVLLISSRDIPQHQDLQSAPVSVGVITVQNYSVVPEVIGFGEVQPDVYLEVKSELAGKVEYTHPELRKGAILKEGTQVLRIDAMDYQLALKQAQANLVKSEAVLREKTLSLENASRSLTLAQEKMSLSQKELVRNEKLLKQGSIAKSTYDAQKQAFLQLEQEVANYDNQVKTLPVQIELQQAQILISQTEVDVQQRNLARTEWQLPFSARVDNLFTETGQFVNQGTPLFAIQNMDKVLVMASIPLEPFGLLSRGFSVPADKTRDHGAPAMGENLEYWLRQQPDANASIMSAFGLSATVQLVDMEQARWSGEVERISNTLDSKSRTLTVMVAVKNPYRDIRPGIRPPLLTGMYAQVSLRGKPLDAIVIPRAVLHENTVYVADTDGRLKRQIVEGHYQGDMLLVEEGLQAGDRVITTDVFPAINGMEVATWTDSAAASEVDLWVRARNEAKSPLLRAAK